MALTRWPQSTSLLWGTGWREGARRARGERRRGPGRPRSGRRWPGALAQGCRWPLQRCAASGKTMESFFVGAERAFASVAHGSIWQQCQWGGFVAGIYFVSLEFGLNGRSVMVTGRACVWCLRRGSSIRGCRRVLSERSPPFVTSTGGCA